MQMYQTFLGIANEAKVNVPTKNKSLKFNLVHHDTCVKIRDVRNLNEK